MDKEYILSRIRETGLVAVVRASSADQALRIAEACVKGGVAALEITYTVPGATDVIKALSKEYNDGEILVGAGTVMDSETARIALLSGAQYIVSPYFNDQVVRLCNRYRVACMPGAVSVREVVQAMEAGADIIKIFPSELYGPSIINAIRAPLPHARMMPTGGVSLNNVEEWIRVGAVAVGVGSQLIGDAETGNYSGITERARGFIARINDAREKMKR